MAFVLLYFDRVPNNYTSAQNQLEKPVEVNKEIFDYYKHVEK